MASVYLARPQPMALAGEVGVQLAEERRSPLGLFDIKNAGQEQGRGLAMARGSRMPSAKPAAPICQIVDDGCNASDDKPVLHRKHSGRIVQAAIGLRQRAPTRSGADTAPVAPTDPESSHVDTRTTDDSGSSTSPAPDPDQPDAFTQTGQTRLRRLGTVLRQQVPRRSDPDPDRAAVRARQGEQRRLRSTSIGTRIHRSRPAATDARQTDRQRSRRTTPDLMGLPTGHAAGRCRLRSANRPEHPWSYTWANPDDEQKMKAAMEDIARTALGTQDPTARAGAKEDGRDAAPKPS